ncbi:MAG: LuxR family transcriptional regulator [Rhodobacteraceae bacterium]|nr:LuxR family transcriptional regulator [Paracoccaceae bacterium]
MIDYLKAILAANSVEEVWSVHLSDMKRYGIDRLLYGMTSNIGSDGIGSPKDLLLLSNHKPEYIEPFIYRRMYDHGPMVRWASRNTGACSWNWVRERIELLSEEEHKVIEFNRARGVTVGYTISFPMMMSGRRSAIGLSVDEGMTQDELDAHWEKVGEEIEVKNTIMNLKLLSLPFTLNGERLTTRQREVLEWVGMGKTTQETSELMNVSAATIEKHLRLAREQLDVETSAQAVLKAALQNQIFLVTPDSELP